MSTYNSPADIEPQTKALSATINNIDAAVAAAFALLPSETNLTRGTTTYAVDTGSVNAYAVALPHTPSGYVDGLEVVFRPLATNTGAATINVNALGVKSIKNASNAAVAAGDITVGVPVTLRYSTTTGFFHVTANSAVSAAAAAASAAAALVSENAAAASEAAALASEDAASDSEAAALVSENAAAASAAAALVSENAAAASEAAALDSENAAAASEAAALVSENAAAASALTAANAPGTNATSTTSAVIGSGSKSLTIQTGKSLVAGMFVTAADTAAPTTKWMSGQISSYDSGTGALVFVVADSYVGVGETVTSWTVSLAPAGGAFSPTSLHLQTYTSFTTSGTATAYTLTPVPALAAYAANNRFNITLHAAPGYNPTININGLGAKNLKYYNENGTKLPINYLATPIGWNSDIYYDGTDFVVVNVTTTESVSVYTQKVIFGYGTTGSSSSLTNLVSNTGVVSTDTAGVGTAREALSAVTYGGDKVLFAYGTTGSVTNIFNYVANNGVVATDSTGVGSARQGGAAAGFGVNKGIFAFGTPAHVSNIISEDGVVTTDTVGVGTARYHIAAARYGGDKAIFAYGLVSAAPGVSLSNTVTNTGVVSSDITGVGTERCWHAAATYDTDKAIFGYGNTNFGSSTAGVSLTNLVSNTGVVATDTTGVGTARYAPAASAYDGGTKSIFGYGYSTSSFLSMTNLVSSAGVVATDTAGVGTVRAQLAAAGFSLT